jgi:glucose-6-phosphate isomerase
MLNVDITGSLAKTLTPSVGLTDQDMTGLRTSMKRFVNEWKEECGAGQHAWTQDIYNEMVIKTVKGIAQRAKKERIQTIVWIGIGGSGLGPKVIQEVFETPNTVEFVIIDTVDPATLQVYLDIIDWKQAMIVVASKSGGTLETMSAFFLYYEALKKARGNKAAARVIALTDPQQGYLHDFSLKQGIEILPIPRDVGGRYSIFSPIGLLPLALLDADLDQFIQGATDMDELCQRETIEENPAALLAGAQFLLDTKKGYRVRVIMPYSHRMRSVGAWNQQLVAESLGKNEVFNPIPLAAVGTQDQHSLLQQWMQGPRAFWHVFIREIEKPRVFIPTNLDEEWAHVAGKSFGQILDAFNDGTAQGLTAAKRPHATISLTRLDEYHLGQLFYCLLAEVVLLGKLYRIDPYGQPGVEMSKNIAKEILTHGRSE